ncbi:MAG: hypothetical protein WC821_01955 [archaeon]|jgi:hypothetical protein
MGFGKKIIGAIKGTYYFFEDKWYNVLDKIDTKIPIYKIIDPIDKIIPSFILFLLFLLFAMVLVGYLIQFSSPYEITFTTLDAKTNKVLPEVLLSGVIEDTEFEEKTNSSGVAIIQIEGPKNNIFEMLFSIIFTPEISLSAVLSAGKEGYESLQKTTIELNSKEYELLLNAKQVEFVSDYPGSTIVSLVDSASGASVSPSEENYVKFNCDNKNITTKTVRDATDGTLDGEFLLIEPDCQFKVVEAGAQGYETSRTTVVLPSSISKHEILLTKIFVPTTGKAKIFVIEEGSTPKKYLPGISVDLISAGGINTERLTLSNGLADFEIAPGKYKVTAFSADGNYYALTEDANLTIDIALSQTSEKEISLRKMDPTLQRYVRVKVLDENGLGPISGVGVTLYSFNDVNGYLTANESNLGVCIDNFSRRISCFTDSNGMLNIGGGLSSLNEGKLIVRLNKTNYLIRIVKANLYKAGEGPQEILIAKADSTNSGTVKVRVKTKATTSQPVQVPLFGADTAIYYDSPDLLITKIRMHNDAVSTDYLGEAYYYNSVAGNYYAKADFDGAHSGLSAVQNLDANKLITFDLNIDNAGSFLEIDILDANTCNEGFCSRLANISSANVKVLKFNDSTFTGTPLSETNLRFASSKFLSPGYTKTSKLLVTVDVNGYVPAMVSINGDETNLAVGLNVYKIKVYPLSLVDNNKPISDSNVSIFFDDLYNSKAESQSGVSSVQQLVPGNEYYAKFNVIISSNAEYNSLLALSRVNSVAEITNILPYLVNHEFSTDYDYTTSCLDLDDGVHDNNYYLPVDDLCNQTTLGGTAPVKVQTGSKWSNSTLPRGTYSFVSAIKLDANANDSQKLIFTYRAKEINSTTTSETLLKTQEFDINKLLRKGVFVTVKINGDEYDILLDSNILPQTNYQYIATNALGKKLAILYPRRENTVSVNVYNNTDTSYNNSAKITVFSLLSATGFDPLLSTTNGTGGIHFTANALKEVIKNTFSMSPRARYFAQTQAYPESYNNTNYLVAVLELNGKTYSVLIDTRSKGKELLLNAKFLAGVTNQNFDGIIYPQDYNSPDLNIQNISLFKVNRGCNSNNLAFNGLNPYLMHINGNTFDVNIPGTYQSGDCIQLSLSANDPELSYNDLNVVIMATVESLDQTLACIDIREERTRTNSVNLEWNTTANLIVENVNCSSAVIVKLATGLICNVANGTNACSTPVTLAVGEQKKFTIKGVNVDYVPSVANSTVPNFTDLLGYFPVYVQAKYASEANKKYVVAKKFDAHVSNSTQCFAISKDIFDWTKLSDSKSFDINSFCQYSLIDDYFIPKATINAFGYDLNYTGKNLVASERFTPSLIVSGKLRETQTEIVNIEGSGSPVTKTKTSLSYTNPIMETVDGNVRKYQNLRYDFSSVVGSFNRLMFRWFDKDNLYYDINSPAGAKIDGDVKITLKDGNVLSITPQSNFNLAKRPTCYGDCKTGFERNLQADVNMQYGLAYIDLSGIKINYIDINIIGNIDNNDLVVEFWPTEITYQQEITKYVSSSSSTDTKIDLKEYSIPPLEGIIFILDSFTSNSIFNNPTFTTTVNPSVYVNSNDSKVVVWVEGNYIKASYIGNNLTNFDNKILNYTVVSNSEYATNNSLGIITVVDYVSPTDAENQNKKISGAS